MSTDLTFSESMNQISGYGGDYERACRKGVQTGALWFAEHLHARPEFRVGRAVTPINAEAHALLAAIEDVDFTREDGTHVPLYDELTSEMIQMILFHVLYIAKHGWSAYVKKMTAPVTIAG